MPEPEQNSTWRPQYLSFNSGFVLEKVYSEIEEKEFTLPTLEIQSIDSNGLLTISFSEPMEIPEDKNELKTR